MVVTTPQSSSSRRQVLSAAGIPLVDLPDTGSGRFSFADLRRLCAAEDLTGVFFEGGSMVAHAMSNAKEIDYLFWYGSPKHFENEDAPTAPSLDSFSLDRRRTAQLGSDLLTRGHLT